MLEARLLEAFADMHPAQAARALESMPRADAAAVLEELSADAAGALLTAVASVSAANALQALPTTSAAEILSASRPDVAAAILRAMERPKRSPIVEALRPEAALQVKPLIHYASDTAGALLDPGVLAVHESITAEDAIERVRKEPEHALYYVYVVNDDQELVAVTNLRELMAARQGQPLSLLATRDVAFVPATASWQTIVAHPAWSRVHALPVLASDRRFLGVIRYEVARRLERRLIETRLESRGEETAAALGELYGIGLRGLVGWVASGLLGPSDSEGGPS